MMKEYAKQPKWKIAAAAVLVGAILAFMTFQFVDSVREQLWEQSIETIRESTQQGLNTLRVQLEEEFQAMDVLVSPLERAGRAEEMDGPLQEYAQVDQGVSLYLEDGTCLPSGTSTDVAAAQALFQKMVDRGILDPHISSGGRV